MTGKQQKSLECFLSNVRDTLRGHEEDEWWETIMELLE